MLPSRFLDRLLAPVMELFETYTISVLEDIARRIARMGKITDHTAWQMQRLLESGLTYQDALIKLNRTTKMGETFLQRLFFKAGVRSSTIDASIYTAAGLKPIPLRLSSASLQILLAGLKKTQGVVKNLTLTSAVSARTLFLGTLDLAYMQVVNGAMSYDQAIQHAVKTLTEKGLSTVEFPSGRRDPLDAAIRRSVLTGVTQTTNEVSLDNLRKLGSDLVQTSAHIGARPEHQEWQGRIFSVSGGHPKYPAFVESTGYGTITGLGGVNCRHSFYPFFEGLSANAYSEATLAEYASETVTYKGKEIPVYEGTQIQRGIERQIRDAKRAAAVAKAAGLDNSKDLARIRTLQAKMRAFIAETSLNRDPSREGPRVG